MYLSTQLLVWLVIFNVFVYKYDERTKYIPTYIYVYSYVPSSTARELYTEKNIQSLKRSICIHEGFTQAHIPQTPSYMKHNISKTTCTYLM